LHRLYWSLPSSDSLIGGGSLVKTLTHSNGLGLWRTYDNDNMLGEIGLYDTSVSPTVARIQRYHRNYGDVIPIASIGITGT
jgi:hypothetical protein